MFLKSNPVKPRCQERFVSKHLSRAKTLGCESPSAPTRWSRKRS